MFGILMPSLLKQKNDTELYFRTLKAKMGCCQSSEVDVVESHPEKNQNALPKNEASFITFTL